MAIDRFELLAELSKYEDYDIQIEVLPERTRWKWEKFSECWDKLPNILNDDNKVIHRKVLNNEIVFDFDAEVFNDNQIAVYYLLNVLHSKGLSYKIFFSGGKGFHIHMYFDYDIINSYPFEEVSKLTESNKIKGIRRKALEVIFENYEEEYSLIKQYIDDCIIDVYRKLIRAEGSKHHKGRYKKEFVLDSPKDIFAVTLEQEMYIQETHKEIKLNKLRLLEPFEEAILLERYQKAKQSAFVFEDTKENKYLRPQVYNLLNKRIIDGRKIALFILCSEMRLKKWSKEKAISWLSKWNSNHTDSLSNILLMSQINQIYSKEPIALRNSTIEEYLKRITFE